MARPRVPLLLVLTLSLLAGIQGAPFSDARVASAAPISVPPSAPAATVPSATWITPFVQDGQSPNEYTFFSILNTGSTATTVTVSFYSKSGTLITAVSNTVAAGQAWQLFTGSAGGVAATLHMDGWAKITSTGGPGLAPFGAVVLPNAGNYPGFSLPFYSLVGGTLPGPTPTPNVVPGSSNAGLVLLAGLLLASSLWMSRRRWEGRSRAG